MKLIDFHTHAFPDFLAPKALSSLIDGVHRSDIPFDDTAFSDGTSSGLEDNMKKSGVSVSVLLPVATKPSQTEGINAWAAETAEKYGNIIPFGAVYPDENAPRCLERLAELGRKGIKLHGDFQGFYADEERMLPVYRKCAELGLIVVMHCGVDCSSPHDVHTTPERVARVLDKVSGVKFVLAHMGGVMYEDRAAELLSGADDLWFDTSYSAGRLSPEKMTELIGRYGAHRVLFASDSPWNDPAGVYGLIMKTELSEQEKELIFHANAEKLLGTGEDFP